LPEQKEYRVEDFGTGKILQLLDSDGNKYIPDEPVDYKIIDEDGSIVKQGTIQNVSEISLDGVESEKFRILISGHVALAKDGFEEPEDEKAQTPPEGPSFDPSADSGFAWDELLMKSEPAQNNSSENLDQKSVSGEPGGEKDVADGSQDDELSDEGSKPESTDSGEAD